MIVVVLVAVLALLAYIGYRRWVMSTAMTEATDMVSNIRTAQDHFFAENGTYLDVSGTLGVGYSYPSAHPGNFKTNWGGVCSTCNKPWDALNISTNGPLLFGYSTVADATNTPAGRGVAIKVNNQAVDLSPMNGKPWYVIEADGDPDGDGVYVHVYAASGSGASNRLWIDGEGN